MIVCTLELWRGGDPNDVELLGRVVMANNLVRSMDTQGNRGDYTCLIYKKKKRVWKSLKITNYPRRSYHPWELVRRILNQAAQDNGGRL